MEGKIEALSIEEREEILVDIARMLESAARDAVFAGDGKAALVTNNMAEAIRVHADEIARDDPDNAERLLQQATAVISQVRQAHPHRVVSLALH